MTTRVLSAALPYLALDRLEELCGLGSIGSVGFGAALFADLSGFSALSNGLVEDFGPRRGAELATQTLNEILEAIFTPVHGWGGAILSSSGDGFLCWFPLTKENSMLSPAVPGSQAAVVTRAMLCAFDMQRAMTGPWQNERAGSMGLRLGLAWGEGFRFVVGDPHLQCWDMLAGEPIARAVAAEELAQPGEIVAAGDLPRLFSGDEDLPQSTDLSHSTGLPEWLSTYRPPAQWANREYIWLRGDDSPRPWPHEERVEAVHAAAHAVLDEGDLRSWLPPFLWARLAAGAEFLAELRPAVAIMARFAEHQLGEDAAGQAALNEYIGWAQRLFVEADGALIQLTLGEKGSYLYGVVGVPAHSDDPARQAAEIAQALALGPGPGYSFRPRAQVGMAQGRMRTGAYGSRTRRTFGVQGSPVNLAARLMMRGEPGAILVDHTIGEPLAPHFDLIPVEFSDLKGFSGIRRAYRLIGERTGDGPVRQGIGLTEWVVRREPLARLADELESAMQGRAVTLAVVGAAGTGKSVLLWQFAEELRQTQRARIFELNCRAFARGAGYGLIGELIGQILGLNVSVAHADFWSELESALTSRKLADAVQLAVLGQVLDRDVNTSATPEQDGLSMEQRREVLASLLATCCRKLLIQDPTGQPAVVLLDDLAVADPASVSVLARAWEQLRSATDTGVTNDTGRNDGGDAADSHGGGVLFVAAGRALPAPLAGGGEPGTETEMPVLALGALSAHEAAEMLARRFDAPIGALTTDVLLHYSQNNPLYLSLMAQEMVERSDIQCREILDEMSGESKQEWRIHAALFDRLQAAGCLRRVAGVWRLRADTGLNAADLGLPDTLHRLVLAQVDRLPVAAALTLKVLAVAGVDVEHGLIRLAHPNRDAAAVDADLSLLARRGLVREIFAEGLQPSGETRFQVANSVLQDVVYESLLDRQRRELHGAIADGYTIWRADATEPIAHHLFRSDLSSRSAIDKTWRALEAAVESARRRYALESALGYVDCLLSLARNSGRDRWPPAHMKFQLLHGLGLREEQAAWLEEMARVPDAPPVELAFCRARYAEAMADYDAAQLWAEEAAGAASSAAASSADAGGRMVAAYCMLGQIARRRGEHALAEAHYRKAQRILTNLDGADWAGRDSNRSTAQQSSDTHAAHGHLGEISYGLGIAARHQGNFAEARTRLEDALEAFSLSNARHDEALTLSALGGLAMIERRHNDAFALHQRALTIRREINDWPGEGATLVSLAQLRRTQGYHADAIELLSAARRIQRSLRDRWWENRILNEIGVIFLIAGMLTQARRAIDEGLALAQAIGDVAGEMVLLLNLGQVLRDLGELDSAADVLRRSLVLAQAQGEKYVCAQCYSDLARTNLLAKRYEQAISSSKQSLLLLEEMALSTAITADLATQIEALTALGRKEDALTVAAQMVGVLDQADGESIDFPQRDYWVAYRLFAAAGWDEQAAHARAQSRRHLERMAERFQDAEMRAAFLDSIPVNREIQRGTLPQA